MNCMTDEIWAAIQQAVASFSGAPEWMKELLTKSHSAIREIKTMRVRVERKAVSESYVQFVRTQLRLAARGPKWDRIWKGRERALGAHVGDTLITATFTHGDDEVLVRLSTAPEMRVLQVEVWAEDIWSS